MTLEESIQTMTETLFRATKAGQKHINIRQTDLARWLIVIEHYVACTQSDVHEVKTKIDNCIQYNHKPAESVLQDMSNQLGDILRERYQEADDA